eukprot:Clim_evm26s238 gene=Clim_evmTU26s238
MTIRAIGKSAVHRICSGQVITSISSVVKELLENSVDAGATNIEIRIKNSGLDSIEVIDNGSGIKAEDYQTIALKHYTSKLSEFDDLQTVSTFGFRGEALSSVCALAELSIVTCTEDQDMGTLLNFDQSGKLRGQQTSARDRGTTVSVVNLFGNLPVRRQELQRNCKREMGKLVSLVQAYALGLKNVRMTLVSFPGQKSVPKGGKAAGGAGARQVLLSCPGHDSIRQNAAVIFGAKQTSQLLEVSRDCNIDMRKKSVKERLEQEDTEEAVEVEQDNNGAAPEDPKMAMKLSIDCLVSSPQHSMGRSRGDRQYVFVNGRPVDLPKLTRRINEAYQSFNRNEYPFLALNLMLDTREVDVNVTPDKRAMFFAHENLVYEAAIECLRDTFTEKLGAYGVNSGSSLGKTMMSKKQSSAESGAAKLLQRYMTQQVVDRKEKRKRRAEAVEQESEEEDDEEEFTDIQSRTAPRRTAAKRRREDRMEEQISRPATDHDVAPPVEEVRVMPATTRPSRSGLAAQSTDGPESAARLKDSVPVEEEEQAPIMEASSQPVIKDWNVDADPEDDYRIPSTIPPLSHEEEVLVASPKVSSPEERKKSTLETHIESVVRSGDSGVAMSSQPPVITELEPEDSGTFPAADYVAPASTVLGDVTVDWKFNGLNEKMEAEDNSVWNLCPGRTLSRHELLPLQKARDAGKPVCEGTEPPSHAVPYSTGPATVDQKTVEQDLERHIDKKDFLRMEILGQFNLGFLIVRLGQDLFIIDQHASDEIYNFERLSRESKLTGQPLMKPVKLELTAVGEDIVLRHWHIFKRYGFDFKHNEEMPPGQQFELTQIPQSKKTVFGPDDVDDMIGQLRDRPNDENMCQPQRLRRMYASRACRSSIMIGTALERSVMHRILRHMSEINRPWHCPHGRPTMRHLHKLEPAE